MRREVHHDGTVKPPRKQTRQDANGHSQLTMQVVDHVRSLIASGALQIGRASCRERV